MLGISDKVATMKTTTQLFDMIKDDQRVRIDNGQPHADTIYITKEQHKKLCEENRHTIELMSDISAYDMDKNLPPILTIFGLDVVIIEDILIARRSK
jgi:hypothetical protein